MSYHSERCGYASPHMQFYEETDVLLPQLLQLLFGFMDRTHQSLAAVGVAALVRLINSAASHMDTAAWMLATNFLMSTSQVWLADPGEHRSLVRDCQPARYRVQRLHCPVDFV